MIATPRISPCLWFEDQAEEAASFYTGIFPDSRITDVTRYTKAGFETHRRPEGSVMVVAFELDGLPFIALNGGPLFHFTEAVSFQVLCDDQDEIDHYWEKLTEGGDPTAQQCGWLKDRFGLSWQVVPRDIGRFFRGGDAAAAARVMEAMLPMKKLELAALQRAVAGSV